MPKMLDIIQMGLRGEIPPPPIATLIGFTLVSVEPGQAVIDFEATERHANPMGTLHGASSATSPTLPWGWPTRAVWRREKPSLRWS